MGADGDRAAIAQSDDQVDVAGDSGPRADEPAIWTLVGAIGQLVLAGWCLMIAGIVLLGGMRGLASPDVGAGIAVLILALLAVFGGVLGVAGLRFLRKGIRSVAIAGRKARFLAAYRRHGDIARAGVSAEGDPLLEGYLRYLVRRGIIGDDESRDEMP